jgi:hypothetical protein
VFQRIPKPLLGCGAILLLMFGCVLASFVFFDRTCYGYLSRRLPIYPGASGVVRARVGRLPAPGDPER